MFGRFDETTTIEHPVELGERIGGWTVERIVREEPGLRGIYEVTSRDRRGTLVLVPEATGHTRDFARRFRRLIRARRSLEHPNLLPVLDGGESHHGVFVVSEPTDAPTLADLLADGPLEPGRAVQLLVQVASALDAGVAAGLIHRELTPEAIRVDREHILLGDFGVARPRSASGMLELLEWPQYLSPEEIRAEPMSAQSNIYSLACILFECLTGEPPFASDWHQAIAYAHLTEDPPRASERRRSLPRAIDDVLVQGLAKEPEDRQESAGELIAGVAQVLEEEVLALGPAELEAVPVEAIEIQAEPEPEPPPPTARRRPGLRAAAATLVACGALGGLVGWAAGAGGDDSPTRSDRADARAGERLQAVRERAAWQTRANRAIDRLGRSRAQDRRRLARAGSKAAQARIATRLSRSFAATATALADPPSAGQRELQSSARRVAGSYGRLARAARQGRPRDWSRASADVRSSERAFRRANARL